MNRIFVPDGFDSTFIENRTNALMFLDFLNWRSMIGKSDRSEWIFISTERLAQLFGRRNLVKPIRDALVASDIIECDYKYFHGGDSPKAFGYRLGPAVINCIFKPYFIKDIRAAKRLAKFRSEKIIENEPPVYTFIRESLRRLSTRDGFEDYIMNEEWTPKRRKRRKRRAALPRVEVDPKAQALSALHLMDDLPRKTYLKPDDQGRIYHLLSNLKKEARAAILLDGAPLYEIDLSNSQLYLMAMLAAHKFLYRILRNTKDRETHTHTYRNQYHSLADDLRLFVEDCCEGIIYEKILQHIEGADRATVKYETIVGLMAWTELSETIAPYQVMKKLYPSVVTLIEDLKIKHGHKWIGRTLQSMEAAVMIGGVCERIRVEHPEIPIIPLHDCLFTTEPHIQTVHKIILEEFGARFGWMPRATVKRVQEARQTHHGASVAISVLEHPRRL
jgi:hypothetical protein